ncbi:MAG: Flp pilus assembly complex ATPase component TadA [Burkholderiales bacterium]|nr:Flp pilus assembly complex ATPase component TadA [Burkholderiales bacterium]
MNLFRSRAPAPSEGSAPRSAEPSKGEGPLGESAVPQPEVIEASMTEFNSARALPRDEVPAARLPVGERAANTAAGPVPAVPQPAVGPAVGELVGGQALLYRIVFLLRQTTLPFSDLLVEEDEPLRLHLPHGWFGTESAPERVTGPQINELLVKVFPGFDAHNPEWKMKRLSRRFSIEGYAVRLTAYSVDASTGQALGYRVMIRRTARRMPDLQQLGLPPSVLGAFTKATSGLILITGRTSTGKTTTALSMLSSINGRINGHILTIEDPVEGVLEPDKCVISRLTVGENTPSFGEGLRTAMRTSPDVIFVGELREPEVIDQVLSYAESGHLVIATMHANSIEGALSRLINDGAADRARARREVLANALVAVLYQTLIPYKDHQHRLLAADAVVRDPEAEVKPLTEIIRSGDLAAMTDITAGKMLSWFSSRDERIRLALERDIVDWPVARRHARKPQELLDAINTKKAAPAASGVARPVRG